MKAANVRGRGGAGFPAGQKWSFLPAGKYPRYLVVNADESEPGTFKDRMIMEYDPHQLIEGIILACYAIEAEQAFIYVRGEYYFAAERLEGAIAEAEAKGFLGDNIFGSGKKLEVVVHRGAGAYECGEETALLTSLEGYRGHPRLKPPFPAVEGLYAKPTIVNNVETIANVPHVLRHGADWYKQWGTPKSTGFRIFCLSGQVKYPGLYELPHGTTLRELIYDYGGGLTEEAGELKAVIPGGLSVQLLDPRPIGHAAGLREPRQARLGARLGRRDRHRRRTRAWSRWPGARWPSTARKAAASARRVARARRWLEEILERIEHGEGRVDDIALMTLHRGHDRRQELLPVRLCGRLGPAKQPGQVPAASSTPPSPARTEQPVIPVRPIYRPDTGVPSGVTQPSLPLEEKYNQPTRADGNDDLPFARRSLT